MPQSILTPDFNVITCEIDIAAPPARVFKAIADAEETRRRAPVLSVYEMDPRVGGRWRLEMRQAYRGVDVVVHDGEILEFDPPRLLMYTWTANFHNDPKHKSIVRWELTPTKSGTHVKLTHSGLASEAESAKAYSGGWPGVLEELKNFVEAQKSERKESA